MKGEGGGLERSTGQKEKDRGREALGKAGSRTGDNGGKSKDRGSGRGDEERKTRLRIKEPGAGSKERMIGLEIKGSGVGPGIDVRGQEYEEYEEVWV